MNTDQPPPSDPSLPAQPAADGVPAEPAAADASGDQAPGPPAKTPPAPNTVTILAVSAVALLVIIVVLMMANRRPGAGTEPDDLTRRRAERDVLRAAVAAERERLGLPPLDATGTSEDPARIAERLSRDAAALAGRLTQFDDVLRQRDTLISQKNSALLETERQLQALTQRVARLQADYDKASAAGLSSESLKRQLDAERQRATDLDRQLREAQASLGDLADRPDPEELNRLRNQLDEARRARDFFDDRNRQLEAELASLRNQPPPGRVGADLFADDESELLPAAVKLFASLRKLENQSEDELMAAYSRLGQELGATVLRKVSFPTGASDLTAEDLTAVGSLATSLPDQGLILVVGYASETGNVDNNRTLSSARATKTAEAINAHKLANQTVQAAYLGQTDRFDSRAAERNQICEVWHILPPAKPGP